MMKREEMMARYRMPPPEDFPGFDDAAALAGWIDHVRSVAFLTGARHDAICLAEAGELIEAVRGRPEAADALEEALTWARDLLKLDEIASPPLPGLCDVQSRDGNVWQSATLTQTLRAARDFVGRWK